MRISRAMVIITMAMLITAVGCTKQVAGTAESDPKKPPLAVSKDGYGIVAGFDNAPKKIEIYTEPQCNHCADLQADFGQTTRLLHRGRATRGDVPPDDVPR